MHRDHLQCWTLYGDQPQMLEIRLRLTSMQKGELIGIDVNKVMVLLFICLLGNAVFLLMCDEYLVQWSCWLALMSTCL